MSRITARRDKDRTIYFVHHKGKIQSFGEDLSSAQYTRNHFNGHLNFSEPLESRERRERDERIRLAKIADELRRIHQAPRDRRPN